jgi:hypothetical protein
MRKNYEVLNFSGILQNSQLTDFKVFITYFNQKQNFKISVISVIANT